VNHSSSVCVVLLPLAELVGGDLVRSRGIVGQV
jgi:hypothetical protein